MRKKRHRIFNGGQNTSNKEMQEQEFTPTDYTDADDDNEVDGLSDTDDDTTILDENDIASISTSNDTSTSSSHISTTSPIDASNSLNDQLLNESIISYIQQLLASQQSQLHVVINQLKTSLEHHEEQLEENNEAILESIESLSNITSSVEEDLGKHLKKFVSTTRDGVVKQLSNTLHEELKATMENGHKNYQILIKLLDQNYSALFAPLQLFHTFFKTKI